MTAVSLVLIGGGEHARVVAEAARSSGRFTLRGFVDPEPCEETARRLSLPRLGDDSALPPDAHAVLGVGSMGVNDVRRRIVERAGRRVAGWATVVHANAWVSPTASIGEGAVIMAGVCINSGARIGRHCVVNTGAILEHDTVLGDFAQLAPGACVGGGTSIGEGAFVGLGAKLRDHVTIGRNVLIGMGAVVVGDVADGASVRGLPARSGG